MRLFRIPSVVVERGWLASQTPQEPAAAGSEVMRERWSYVNRVAQRAGGTLLLFAAIGLTASGATHAQEADSYPNRPVRIIVPFAPGSTVDILARTLSEGLSNALKQPFVVENRPGASGNLGMSHAAKSAPDGYTLLISSVNLVVNPSLYASVGFNPEKDFAPISMIARTPNVLVTHPGVPVGSVRELIEFARANPGKLNYASSGIGTTVHLSGELFNRMAGVKVVHVPYKGPVEMLSDVMAGRVDITFANLVSALPFVRAGKLKVLGVTSAQRQPSLPDVPTIAEGGLVDYEAVAWFGLAAPGGTPKPIIEKLNRITVATLKQDAVRERLNNGGIEVVANTPEQFSSQIKSETVKWTEVIKMSGAKAE